MSLKDIRLSVIIIARNEEERIGTCIDSLSFADEVVVADNGSTDETVKIAVKKRAVVSTYKTSDFAKLRNNAAKAVSGNWILYVDADEVVSPTLATNILEHISSNTFSGYELFRKNYYLGKLWPTGEWKLRLFRKEALKKWFGALHESPAIEGVIGRIEGDLLHDTHRTRAEMVAKTNEWSETEAILRLEANHPPVTWWRILRMILTGFWDSYIKQGGWRVGTVGVIESMYQGFSMFVTYAKLWEMQDKSQPSNVKRQK